MRVESLLTIVALSSCACARHDEGAEFLKRVSVVRQLEHDVVATDDAGVRIELLETLAKVNDEIADVNDQRVERECGRLRAAELWVVCQFESSCIPPGAHCTFTESMNEENVLWRQRAKEAREAADRIRSSLRHPAPG